MTLQKSNEKMNKQTKCIRWRNLFLEDDVSSACDWIESIQTFHFEIIFWRLYRVYFITFFWSAATVFSLCVWICESYSKVLQLLFRTRFSMIRRTNQTQKPNLETIITSKNNYKSNLSHTNFLTQYVCVVYTHCVPMPPIKYMNMFKIVSW